MLTNPAFEAALDANPADQTTRGIYADWLEDHLETEEDNLLISSLRWQVWQYYSPVLRDGHWLWFFGNPTQPGQPHTIIHLPTRKKNGKQMPKRIWKDVMKRHNTRLSADLALGRFLHHFHMGKR